MDYVTIALPKGRLAEDTVNLMSKLNIVNSDCIDFNSRKLIFEDSKNRIKFILKVLLNFQLHWVCFIKS